MPRRELTTYPTQQRFIRLSTAADRWDVSVKTIRRLISAGKLTGYQMGSRVMRVDQSELDACFRKVPTLTRGGAA